MLEIFSYTFMQNAFLAGVFIAILAPLAGSFMVLRRYSLLGETLAHVSLVGVSVGLLAGVSTLAMAVIFSIAASILIEYLRSYHKIYSDSVLAIFLSGSLALAIVIVSLSGSFNSSLFSYLFGSILAINRDDLYIIGGVGILSIILFITFFKELYAICYDEDIARVMGIRVNILNIMLVSIIATIIAISIKIIGSLLIGALMVIPVVSAIRFGYGFFITIIIAISIAIFSVMTGLFASYIYSIPSGASIVLVLLLVFIFSLFMGKK